jgi:hypothetical protein
MIPAYSPEARGRSERNFATWQGRLPQELRLHPIGTPQAANQFLREPYVAEFNQRFQVAVRQRGNTFGPFRSRDLEWIFSLQVERSVNRNNTANFQNLSLQIERVRWRETLAGCQVVVHQHLHGTLSLTHGPHCLGRYTAQGTAFGDNENAGRTGGGKAARRKGHKANFSAELGNPAQPAGFPLSQRPDGGCWLTETGHIMCYEKADILTGYEQAMDRLRKGR